MKRLLLAVTILLAANQVWAAGGKGYVGPTAPATCAVGNFWIDTDGAANDRFYTCTATNTWTKNSGGSYTLPTATADTLGGVKVGDRLTITDGKLSGTDPAMWVAGVSYVGGGSLVVKDGVHCDVFCSVGFGVKRKCYFSSR